MNNKAVSISVIMPVYNGEKFLREAVDSILSQTYQNFEFIIINDGSTDKSEEIILSYNDARIVYVKNETNSGIIKTLNKGIDLVKGQYIARMDADDISLPNRFEEQMKVFSTRKNIDLVHTQVKLLDKNGKIGHLFAFAAGFEAIRFITPFRNLIIHPTIMVKAEVLKSYRYRDDESVWHVEDLDLWLRMLNDGYLVHTIEKPLLLYRLTDYGIGRLHSDKQTDNSCFLLRQYLNQNFPELEIRDNLIGFFIGKKEKISFSLYVQAKLFINCYIDTIEKKGISKVCKNDLIYWKNYFLLKNGLLVFKNVNYFDKIKVLLQLICLSPVFYYKHFRKFIFH